ncbi:hypothetical protein BH24DEI2_BH24DEI2_12400 [soil metagenome]
MAQPSGTSPFDLTQYRWQNRLVLLFAPSPEDASYQQQTAVLEAEEAGLQDRDIVVFHLFSDTFSDTGHVDRQSLIQNEVEALRKRFDIGENTFTFVLIGKDGTVKRRSEETVSVNDLFDQIDAMPMRQREMDAP